MHIKQQKRPVATRAFFRLKTELLIAFVRLPSEQPHDKRQDGRDQQASHQGEVETEVVTLDVDVARQSAEPGWESGGEGDDQTGSDQDQSQNDQWPAEPVHAFFSRGR